MALPIIEGFVDRVIAIRREGGDLSPETHPELSGIATKLDKIWWGEVEAHLTNAARSSPDRLLFSKEKRLLLDCGVLDYRLIDIGDRIRADLLRELYAEGGSNHFYFSQWMERQYKAYVLYGHLGMEEKGGAAAKNTGKREKTATGKMTLIRQARSKIYFRMSPLFQNLPGFPPKVVDLLLSGRLDETLQSLTARLGKNVDPRLAEQRKQLVDIRSRLISKARARATQEAELTLFDALAKVDKTEVDRSTDKGGGALKVMDGYERIKFATDELKLVRSLLRLGVAGAGITRTHCTLLSSQRRVTKAALGPIMEKIEECDPYLPGPPSILIAPYVGTGFYEWDRDTIFVPLIATRPIEEAVVNAIANYRILLDSLHNNGMLRKGYEKEFGTRDFRNEFIRDYRNWVLGVGRGVRGALDTARYQFFLKHLGPSVEYLYAPAAVVRMTPEETREMIRGARRKVNRAEADWQDHYHLAVAYHRQQRDSEALEELTQAVEMNPIDGRLLCALGYLAALSDSPESGRACFREAIAINPNTLWHVLAAEAMQKV